MCSVFPITLGITTQFWEWMNVAQIGDNRIGSESGVGLLILFTGYLPAIHPSKKLTLPWDNSCHGYHTCLEWTKQLSPGDLLKTSWCWTTEKQKFSENSSSFLHLCYDTGWIPQILFPPPLFYLSSFCRSGTPSLSLPCSSHLLSLPCRFTLFPSSHSQSQDFFLEVAHCHTPISLYLQTSHHHLCKLLISLCPSASKAELQPDMHSSAQAEMRNPLGRWNDGLLVFMSQLTLCHVLPLLGLPLLMEWQARSVRETPEAGPVLSLKFCIPPEPPQLQKCLLVWE